MAAEQYITNMIEERDIERLKLFATASLFSNAWSSSARRPPEQRFIVGGSSPSCPAM